VLRQYFTRNSAIADKQRECATRSEILTFKKYRDLETEVRGHWRSLKVVSFDRLDMLSY